MICWFGESGRGGEHTHEPRCSQNSVFDPLRILQLLKMRPHFSNALLRTFLSGRACQEYKSLHTMLFYCEGDEIIRHTGGIGMCEGSDEVDGGNFCV